MAATKKPSGLSIARNGMKFTLSWKIADKDYGGGQQLQWRIWSGSTGAWTKWQSVSVSNTATSASVSFSAADYWPNKNSYFWGIHFWVRGKRSSPKNEYAWSDWAKCIMDLTAPETPSLTAALSDTYSNVTTFSWTTPNVSNTNLKPFYDVEWQTILVKESNVTDGSKLAWKSSTLGWATGTGAATGSSTRTEDSTLLAQNSYTRWFRVRARGCGGNGGIKGCSYWRYAKHVYAIPYTPVVNSASKEAGSLTWVKMTWTASADAAHPIDTVTPQWAIDTPGANLSVPGSVSWNTVTTLKDTGGTDASRFLINDSIGTDECLWVRVGVTHDSNFRANAGYFVYGGKLSAPSGLSVVTNDQTYRATVTATNNSSVPDSVLAVVFRRPGKSDIVVGVIPQGESSVTVQCPNWSGESAISFGVYAFQGSYIGKGTLAEGITSYAITAKLKSDAVWEGGAVPTAPSDVTVNQSETSGEVVITWTWSWLNANQTEISWSENPNAWESTDEPATYVVSSINTAQWRVSGLAVGTTWYFRLRFGREVDDEVTYGPYSDTVAIDLSSAPNKPMLSLTRSVISEPDGAFTASWNYVSTDGTGQAFAEIKQVTYTEEVVTYGQTVATATTARHVDFGSALAGWVTGGIYYLVVRVVSASGHESAWSDPVAIAVAEPISISVSTASLVSETLDDGSGGTRTVMALEEMPIELTVTGAGAGGTTSVVIERAATYILDRPDESRFNGWEGEAICTYSQPGEDPITINLADLNGLLDDGAPYRLIATVQDTYGQSAEETIDFEVHWTHQALIPEGRTAIGDGVAVITPIEPADAEEGDTCDIYRLSADKPVKIVEGAAFGTAYVDPYPAIGETGGYRIVYMTSNGDYITADNELAWIDIPAYIDSQKTIIDFDGHQVELVYDMDVTNTWTKDFTETVYLGGAVQGDWNLAVHRSTAINADMVVTDDPELIASMRRLAVYPGVCHVRTVDGSSFSANVVVKEKRTYETAGKVAAFALTITRVDSQTLDGMLYSEWVAS